jgi:hypothetical protein
MNQSKSIQLWANQFQEHLGIAHSALNSTGVLLPSDQLTKLNTLKKKWTDISKKPSLFKKNKNIIEETLTLKKDIRDLFETGDIDCFPNLLDHMIEELDYFREAIIEDSLSHLDEMHWWAKEHSENLDFVNCRLPELIVQDQMGTVAEINNIILQNNNLSEQFKNLLSETDEMTLYRELMYLKVQHLNGISELIWKVEQLPLSAASKNELYVALHHESVEATYAFERLESFV